MFSRAVNTALLRVLKVWFFCTGRTGRNSPPAYSNGPGNSWTQAEFVPSCIKMIESTRSQLGAQAPIFDRPVDGRAVPDYYTVVKKPMDLGTLKQRLLDGRYKTPQEFAEVCVQLIRC